MPKEKVGGYISNIKFNDDTSLAIKQNDIIVFVGPNNAGKSQALKDIYSLSNNKVPSIVVSDISISKYSQPISSLLDEISEMKEIDGSYKQYNVLGKEFSYFDHTENTFSTSSFYNNLRDLFVANLDTSARLTICNAPINIARNAPKTHPIHYAAFDKKYRKWLSDNFEKAFGLKVTPNICYGAKVPLCIGDSVKLEGEYEDEQSRQEIYADILDNYKQVQDQGDGVKSFTGILLYLMLDYFCTFLIDEPESFLHPPQAYIMGQIIGKTLTNQQQCIISTHSEEIIKGLLEVCPNRIKIIRITREKDVNYFSVLDNDKFGEIWNDPLLKYSNIMSSLFHKSVVLCEGDSDCKIYSIVENNIKQSQDKYSETLFIHCGGKQRMHRIVIALRALNIDIKLIPDIDIMNNETIFRNIIEAFGMEWTTIKEDYDIIVSNIHSSKETINRNDAKAQINAIFENSQDPNLSKNELSQIHKIISTTSKWQAIKTGGVSMIPSGESTAAFKRLDQKMRDCGIYMVPVGEVEKFVKEIGGHGAEWVNKVLEEYPDLNDEIYKPIKEFIKSMNL